MKFCELEKGESVVVQRRSTRRTPSIPLFAFTTLRVGDNIVLAGNPAKDYPPSNIASMIKQCEAAGWAKGGKLIMDQWNRTVDKYPKVRVSWPVASKIGESSVKKNVFEYKEFSVWLEENVGDLQGATKKAAKAIPMTMIKEKGPGIPTDKEAPEDWAAEARKTKKMLDEGLSAFASAEEYIEQILQPEITTLKRYISDYGPGGPKYTNKSGKVSKLADRIPKWEAKLQAHEQKVEELQGKLTAEKKKFEGGKKAYETGAPCTVAVEQETQKALKVMMEIIMNTENLEQQRKMLQNFNKMIEKQGIAASVEVNAGILNKIGSWVDKLGSGIKKMFSWFNKLSKSVDSFQKVAMQYGR